MSSSDTFHYLYNCPNRPFKASCLWLIPNPSRADSIFVTVASLTQHWWKMGGMQFAHTSTDLHLDGTFRRSVLESGAGFTLIVYSRGFGCFYWTGHSYNHSCNYWRNHQGRKESENGETHQSKFGWVGKQSGQICCTFKGKLWAVLQKTWDQVSVAVVRNFLKLCYI